MHHSDDIANLFNRLGAHVGDYQEIESVFEYHEESLPPTPAPAPSTTARQPLSRLLQEIEQQRQRLEAASDAPRAFAPMGKARVVAVVSAQGGVGKSTLAGVLANALKRPGGRTLALDLSPQNALCLHVGGTLQWPGIAQNAGGNGRELLREGYGRSHCLAYGVVDDVQRVAFEQRLANDPLWLAGYLAALDLNAHDTVIIDTPPGASVYLSQALEVADVVVVVTTAEAASYASLDQMDRLLAPYLQRPAPAHCTFVINQLDTSRQFSLDMCAVLKNRTGMPLLGVVRQDHFLSESLAYDRDPLAHTPNTRGCQDALDLIESLRELLVQATREL